MLSGANLTDSDDERRYCRPTESLQIPSCRSLPFEHGPRGGEHGPVLGAYEAAAWSGFRRAVEEVRKWDDFRQSSGLLVSGEGSSHIKRPGCTPQPGRRTILWSDTTVPRVEPQRA